MFSLRTLGCGGGDTSLSLSGHLSAGGYGRSREEGGKKGSMGQFQFASSLRQFVGTIAELSEELPQKSNQHPI